MNQNNAAIRLLERGMTEQEVTDRIGSSGSSDIPNPFRSEMYPAGEDEFKILFFYTNRTLADGDIEDDELTPVVFKNGLLDGWGWSYWENTALRYNIRIRGDATEADGDLI